MIDEKPWTELSRQEKGDRIRPLIEVEQLSYSAIGRLLGVSRVAIAGAADRNRIVSPYSRGARPGVIGSKGGTASLAKRNSSLAVTRKKFGKQVTLPPRRAAFIMGYVPPESDPRPAQAGAWAALPGTDPQPLDRHRPGQCAWPLGDGPFTFCCAPIQAGKPYCPTHSAIAYKPAVPIKFKGRKTA